MRRLNELHIRENVHFFGERRRVKLSLWRHCMNLPADGSELVELLTATLVHV